MKRLTILFIILSLCLFGCAHELPLQQPSESIFKIELINEEEGGVLCTLTGSEANLFFNDLLHLKCHKNLNPSGDFGHLQIRIYYENGDVDIVGYKGDGRIAGGVLIVNGWYYFAKDDLVELFKSYSEKDSIIAEINT